MPEREALPTAQVGAHFRQLGDQLSTLVNDHVELARAELRQTVARTGRDAALVAAGMLLFGLGYLLLAVSVSVALGHVLGFARSFLLVALLHLVVGGALAAVFSKRLQRQDKPSLPTTAAALQEDRRFARQLGTQLTQHRH